MVLIKLSLWTALMGGMASQNQFMQPVMAHPSNHHITTFTEHKHTYQAALRSLFNGKVEDAASDCAKLFTPDFTQRDDTGSRNYSDWVRHVTWLRQNFAGAVELNVTVFLKDGHERADRHNAKLTYNGTSTTSETFMFVKVAKDGRILKIVETVPKHVCSAQENGK
ncbi:hypothetical protein QWA68_015252 [Fusarium oxysporum]|nr:hypothetical protein QWA68_015252 [Fusarium oxysporum]